MKDETVIKIVLLMCGALVIMVLTLVFLLFFDVINAECAMGILLGTMPAVAIVIFIGIFTHPTWRNK